MRANAQGEVYAQPIFEDIVVEDTYAENVGLGKISLRKIFSRAGKVFKKVAIPAAIVGGAIIAPKLVTGTTQLLTTAKNWLISRGVPPALANIKARDIVAGKAPVPPEVQQELAAQAAEASIFGGGMMPLVLLGGGALLVFMTIQPARRRRR